jgi:DNA-directed RNA polymerase subunit RPC12/RpoP
MEIIKSKDYPYSIECPNCSNKMVNSMNNESIYECKTCMTTVPLDYADDNPEGVIREERF